MNNGILYVIILSTIFVVGLFLSGKFPRKLNIILSIFLVIWILSFDTTLKPTHKYGEELKSIELFDNKGYFNLTNYFYWLKLKFYLRITLIQLIQVCDKTDHNCNPGDED